MNDTHLRCLTTSCLDITCFPRLPNVKLYLGVPLQKTKTCPPKLCINAATTTGVCIWSFDVEAVNATSSSQIFPESHPCVLHRIFTLINELVVIVLLMYAYVLYTLHYISMNQNHDFLSTLRTWSVQPSWNESSISLDLSFNDSVPAP